MSEQLQFGAVTNELDALVGAALTSPELTRKEKQLLGVLNYHRGAASAIRSGDLAACLQLSGFNVGLGEGSRRWIAAAVETLVQLHGIPIGGLRVPPYGYFLIETRADLDLAIGARWSEVYAHLRYLRRLMSKKDVARMFGQQMLEIDGGRSR